MITEARRCPRQLDLNHQRDAHDGGVSNNQNQYFSNISDLTCLGKLNEAGRGQVQVQTQAGSDSSTTQYCMRQTCPKIAAALRGSDRSPPTSILSTVSISLTLTARVPLRLRVGGEGIFLFLLSVSLSWSSMPCMPSSAPESCSKDGSKDADADGAVAFDPASWGHSRCR